MAISWPQALAWRLRRQLLEPVGDGSAADVVRALGPVPTQNDVAELAVGVRRRSSRPGDVTQALADGELVMTFAFRGAVHLMTPEDAGTYLALRADTRMWELPSWQTYYGLAPSDWPDFRVTVQDDLAGGPLTLAELTAAVTSRPAYRGLDVTWTLVKALAWQGDLCFGPPRDGSSTLQRLDTNQRWTGLLDVDEAGPRAIEAYVRAYGPTTADHVHRWLGEGLGAGRKRLRSWVAGLGDRLAEVDVEGEPAIILRDDLAELSATPPTTAVRLLPRYDQWVLGPGTADTRIVPPGHRQEVSRGANVVLVGGVVSGTWAPAGDEVAVTWFPEAPPVAPDELAVEVQRVASLVRRQSAPLLSGSQDRW